MSLDNVRALFEARQNAVAELRALDTDAKDRAFTAEESEKFNRLNAAIDDYDARSQAILDQAAKEKRATDAMADVPSTDRSKNADEAERAAKFWREARNIDVKAPANVAKASEFRDLTAGVATDGAELVPTTLYGTLVESLREFSQIMAMNPTVLRTSGGDPIVIPKVTSYSSASLITGGSGLPGEGQSIPESDPQFGTVQLDAYKLGFAVQATTELLQDSAFDVPGFLARQGGEALALGIDTYLTTGTGSSQPQGVVNVSTGATAASTTAITTDELIDLMHSVKRPYRAGSGFLMHDNVVKAVRKLKDSNGQYVWQPSLVAGQPDTLFGRPVYVSPDMDGTLAATDTAVIFGDLGRALYVRFAGPIRIERSDEYAFLNDLITWRFLMRFDSVLVDTEAAKKLVMAAS